MGGGKGEKKERGEGNRKVAKVGKGREEVGRGEER